MLLRSPKRSRTRRQKTHSLIRASGRRPIQISPQINPQTLALTHIPRGDILALNARRAPSKSIALVSESAERVLARGERDGQISGGSVRLLAHVGVQFRAFGVDELDQLAVDDLELACGRGVGEDRSAWGGVQGGCLQVFVVVWRGDGADPGVAALEG